MTVTSAASPLANVDAPIVRPAVVDPVTPPPAPIDCSSRPSLPNPLVNTSAFRLTVTAAASRFKLDCEPRIAVLDAIGA